MSTSLPAPSSWFRVGLRHGLVVLLGAAFALGLVPLWSLEQRWFKVAALALLLIGVALVFARRLPDFILVFLFFTIPFADFTKWFFLDGFDEVIKGAALLSGAVALGLNEFLLAALYLLWFVRLFITRTAPCPRLERIDLPILLLGVAYVCSLLHEVPSSLLGVSALVHLVKHALLYFYVSRNLRAEHLRWLVLAATCAILLEAPLGLLQNRTGMLRLLVIEESERDRVEQQFAVPGIEDVHRATGTLLGSHVLGLYFAMLLPYAFVRSVTGRGSAPTRWLWLLVFVLGVSGLVVTFSRSAWISCALSLAIGWGILLVLRGRQVLVRTAPLLVLLLVVAPWAVGVFVLRFGSAPPSIMTARYTQYRVALDLWSQHPLTGCGAGNFMLTAGLYPHETEMYPAPVHNQFLFLATELGLFGVASFYALVAVGLAQLWGVIRAQREPTFRVALAVFVGLVAYLLDGLTHPAFRAPAVYEMFWLSVALSVALPRLLRLSEPEA